MAVATGDAALKELDTLLQSMQSLKAPGIAKSKVDGITRICTAKENAERQLSIVDTILANFQRSAATHKLGVMYIVDTLTRQWLAAGDTWTTAVQRVTTVLPMLMSELIRSAPDGQKEKIGKLIDIWVQCKTFPEQILMIFKQQLITAPAAVPAQPVASNTTQQVSAPPAPQPTAQAPLPVSSQMLPSTNPPANNLFAALSSLQPPPASVVPQVPHYVQPPPLYGHGSVPLYSSASAPVSSNAAPVAPATAQAQVPATAPVAPIKPVDANVLNMIVAAINQSGGLASQSQPQQIQTIQALAQYLPQEQLLTVISQLNPAGMAPPAAAATATPPQASYPGTAASYPPPTGPSYGYNGADVNATPVNQSGGYNNRDGPSYSGYDAHANGQSNHQDERRGSAKAKGKNQRGNSPQQGRNRPNSPPKGGKAPRPLAFDESIAKEGKLRVLSRTLFVGGVRTGETELTAFFSRFGAVQSCIVNDMKRHAFLKLCSHQDAATVKVAVETLPHDEYRSLFERVGWAVGFGPTHCADYQAGVSVIPLDVLTDADRRWMISSEYGGTGGKPLEPGVVVEEPDIEIGAGPSSKAISRRGGHQSQATQRGGNYNGHRQQHKANHHDRHQPYQKPNRKDHHNNHQGPAHHNGEPTYTGPPPPVPTFGGGIPGLW